MTNKEFALFLQERGIKRIVGLDFETYFNVDYTLRKVTTTLYCRDKRFKAQCVAMRNRGGRKAKSYFGRFLEPALKRIDWKTTALLCHNTQFDGYILSQQYKIKPKFYFCTLSMARPLHGGAIKNNLDALAEHYNKGNKLPDILTLTKGVRDLPRDLMRQLRDYNEQDVDIMWGIFEEMLPHYPADELDLIHHTIGAFAQPVLIVNENLAKSEYDRAINIREKLIESTGYTREQLRSRPQFAQALIKLGEIPPMKISPANGEMTYAFAKNDRGFIDLLKHPTEKIQNLAKAKSACSSNQAVTRPLTLIAHGRPTLPIMLHYGKAHTFRWSGGDKMNPQNFERGGRLRNAITAPKGHKLVIVDSSQIEARVVALLAGQMDLVADFADNKDIYSIFAGENIYNRPINKKDDPEERFVGKVAILSLGFQSGVERFRDTLELGNMGPPVKLEDDMYAKIVYGYRRRYAHIPQLWQRMQQMLGVMYSDNEEEYGPLTFRKSGVLLPNGMQLLYPNLRPTVNNKVKNTAYFKESNVKTVYGDFQYNDHTKIYGGYFTENLCQALARLVVAQQILRVANKYKTVLLVHDEVILCVPNKQAERAYEKTMKAFQTPPDWWPDLPVAAEGGIYDFYTKD